MERQALGQQAPLGALYNAYNDTVLPISVFNKASSTEKIAEKTSIWHKTTTTYSRGNDLAGAFRQFNISPGLGASILGGMASPRGIAGRLLSLSRSESSSSADQLFVLHDILTARETLSFETIRTNKQCLAADVLNSPDATHVISEVVWGRRIVLEIRDDSIKEDDFLVKDDDAPVKDDDVPVEGDGVLVKDNDVPIKEEDGSETPARPDKLIALVKRKLSAYKYYRSPFEEDLEDGYRVKVFEDANSLECSYIDTLDPVVKKLNWLSRMNSDKGDQLFYTLLPISEFATLVNSHTLSAVLFVQVGADCFRQSLQLFRKVCYIKTRLGDHIQRLEDGPTYASERYTAFIKDKYEQLSSFEQQLQAEYAGMLKNVRRGDYQESLLLEFVQSSGQGNDALTILDNAEYLWQEEKMALIKDLVAAGARYDGFQDSSVMTDAPLNDKSNEQDYFVFSLGDQPPRKHATLDDHSTLSRQLLGYPGLNADFFVRDSLRLGEIIAQPNISFFRNGRKLIENVLEDQQLSNHNCRAWCETSCLDDSGAPEPISRVIVKIPCPNTECDQNLVREWICARCNSPIEYGNSDEFIYCACGRCDYKHWSFICNSSEHDIYNFAKYEPAQLFKLLEALVPCENLNLLILGRTGVGKSTWINAYVNYLKYKTLDAALEKKNKLEWVIPFSFHVNSLNEKQEYATTKIKVDFAPNQRRGSNAKARGGGGGPLDDINERDGAAGGSSTQGTLIHRVRKGNTMIRLIDTPGIGDTEGAEKDKKNMADILSVLRTYEKIHGILILLKPNEQRLDVMFKFCFQELLTHLHRDAARNIVFCFTNARGTNFGPGDTFGPLQELLKKFGKIANITLSESNVYYFDSESFRYLAAKKVKNYQLGNLDDNRKSWELSCKASNDLVEYCRGLSPHNITSTVNLYETRHRIARLAKPMATIVDDINSAILKNKVNSEKNATLGAEEKNLKGRLRLPVIKLSEITLNQPYTTCADRACIGHKSTGEIDGEGRDVLRTVYKSDCHRPCYLRDVSLDNIGTSELQHCYAMYNGICRVCNHAWSSHLHVQYDLEERVEEVINPAIEKALQENTNLQEKQNNLIKGTNQVIQEFQQELEQVKQAAAQFGVFLKTHAIMPYNDATLEYLERLISDEKAKVEVGGSRQKLENHQRYYDEYKQQVSVLENYMNEGKLDRLLNQEGIDQAVAKLYAMKHYGKTIQELGKAMQNGAMTTNRETQNLVRALSFHERGGGSQRRTLRYSRPARRHQPGGPSREPNAAIVEHDTIPESSALKTGRDVGNDASGQPRGLRHAVSRFLSNIF